MDIGTAAKDTRGGHCFQRPYQEHPQHHHTQVPHQYQTSICAVCTAIEETIDPTRFYFDNQHERHVHNFRMTLMSIL